MKKKIVIGLLAACMIFGGIQNVYAAMVYGTLNVSWHIIPLLKDEAWAYTSISMPSKELSEARSYTTVKIYNSNGTYASASDTEKYPYDLPLETGAKAYIRAAVKAVGTHKAKSYDTNYQWIKTSDTKWEK